MQHEKFPYKEVYERLMFNISAFKAAYPRDGLRNFQLLEVSSYALAIKDDLDKLLNYIQSRV